MGWEVGGWFKNDGMYVHLWLIHVDVWQKPTTFCKAIILQFKNKLKTWLKAKKKKKSDPVLSLKYTFFKPCSSDGKEFACNAGDAFDPWVGKMPWRRKWQCAAVFLPGESHGQRSLAGYSPWGHTEWPQCSSVDMTEQLMALEIKAKTIH